VKAKIGEYKRHDLVVNYIAECTRLISYNTASCARGDEGGQYISVALADMEKEKEKENKTETTDTNEILERVNAMLARMRGDAK
jgi:hypothetical protein